MPVTICMHLGFLGVPALVALLYLLHAWLQRLNSHCALHLRACTELQVGPCWWTSRALHFLQAVLALPTTPCLRNVTQKHQYGSILGMPSSVSTANNSSTCFRDSGKVSALTRTVSRMMEKPYE